MLELSDRGLGVCPGCARSRAHLASSYFEAFRRGIVCEQLRHSLPISHKLLPAGLLRVTLPSLLESMAVRHNTWQLSRGGCRVALVLVVQGHVAGLLGTVATGLLD